MSSSILKMPPHLAFPNVVLTLPMLSYHESRTVNTPCDATILASRKRLEVQKSRRQKMYYRVATQVDPVPTWQWRSTVLSSLDTLFQFLRSFVPFRTIACACSLPPPGRIWRATEAARTLVGSPPRSRQHNFCSREGSVCQRGQGKRQNVGNRRGS